MLQLLLKEEQKQAIHSIYCGSDVFVWLRTESRKSVCFQTLPFVFDFIVSSSPCSESLGMRLDTLVHAWLEVTSPMQFG